MIIQNTITIIKIFTTSSVLSLTASISSPLAPHRLLSFESSISNPCHHMTTRSKKGSLKSGHINILALSIRPNPTIFESSLCKRDRGRYIL